jgi:PAS domain S-box-containing protein
MTEHTDRWEDSLAEGGRHKLLVEAIEDYAIYMLDPTGTVTSWNTGAKRFKGYEAWEIIGEHFSRFYVESDRRAGLPEKALERAAGQEGKFEGEGWRLRKDGGRFWAHVVIDPIRDASGRLIGFAKITRDLSERRAAEEALRRSEEQFRILVQGVTDYAIFMLSPEGLVTSWNAGAQRIKGYLPEEIIGQHFSRFYVDEDQQKGVPRQALEVSAREGRFEKEGWRVRKDGSRFWANVVIDPVHADDGSILGFAKVTRDVTERRQSERALEQAREALFQSQKIEAIGQLTGGVAHDFNNLLMAILGSLELMRKRLPDDPKIIRLLDNAVQGALRGAALTQRMLAFGRQQELKPAPLDVPSLVRGMTDLLERSVGPSVQIEIRFPPNLPKVMADSNQLELALLNLVVNARDAMPRGGGIVIAAREGNSPPGMKSGRAHCLSVTDTGEGMDEATLTRALEPFFTTKGVGKGTGLGLSMVHGMTEQSGGKFILNSRIGEGATAEIWLPLAASVAQAEGAHARRTEQAGDGAVRALVIVAVDDDALVLFNTTSMLEDLGHTVFEAASGRQALEIIREQNIVDLVITDQAMPNMTGSELANAIKAEWPHLPVLLATGYAELPAGGNAGLPRLSKPFRQRDLAQAIVNAISDSTKAVF